MSIMLSFLKSLTHKSAVQYTITPGESFFPDIESHVIEPEIKELMYCSEVKIPEDITVQEIIDRSKNFPLKFPIESVLCSSLAVEDDIALDILKSNVNSVYPVLHENAFFLFCQFLRFKRQYGSKVEQQLYKNMTVIDLVHRFLVKRAVAFVGAHDRYLLLDGTEGVEGWEDVGTDKETAPLLLEKCLSYDEMKLSAFLSVSSHTVFVNDGSRLNCGKPCTQKETIERQGVIVGLIGPRLKKSDVMETQEILITYDFNVPENGYGASGTTDDHNYKWRKMWANFYGIHPNFPTFTDKDKLCIQENEQRIKKLNDSIFFDNAVYKRRLAVSLEMFLLEAEHRGQVANKNVYLHVVGIGLGVWRISNHQDELFLELFADIFKKLSNALTHISDLHFGWFKADTCGGISDGNFLENAKVHFSREPPHVKLNDDKLLVVSYAWDCNALPGNEFWWGSLHSSSDPAAACSTQVAEIHNPQINPKVSGNNLHIASRRWGIQHISKYADSILLSVNLNCV